MIPALAWCVLGSVGARWLLDRWERRRIASGWKENQGQLKRYCELDTLAMVMVYEALREWVR